MLVAMLMVPLVGFAALAVDAASVHSTRQQLQTGADAAALAVAQDCGRNACGSPSQTATTLATANVRGGSVAATIQTPSLSPSTGTVTVRTTATRSLTFARVLGYSTANVSASATARWGAPSGGLAALPLTFSWCEFKAQTGGGLPSATTPYTIRFTKSSGTSCTGPSGNVVPGGFGWLDPNPGSCQATTSLTSILWSSTGNSVPSGCSVSYLTTLRNTTVLLPIFDSSGDSGANAYYRVYAYAAFTITGYYFAGQYSWNPPCNGEARCIRGYFTRLVRLDQSFTYTTTAPQLGASVVALTQ